MQVDRLAVGRSGRHIATPMCIVAFAMASRFRSALECFMAGLTNKQRAFVDEYLQCWNATEAALRAGYSERSAYSIGHENLKKPEIAKEIQRRIDERAMTADEVLIRLAEQARGGVEEFVEIKAGMPFFNWERLVQSGKLHLVKKLKYNSNGQPEVEFYDAQAALVQLGRHHGLFTDRQEISGPGGEPLTVRVVYEDTLGDGDE